MKGERGCRTPIRSIAAYSPYTFTTSLEFRALRFFFFLPSSLLWIISLEQRYPRDYANAYNIEISSDRRSREPYFPIYGASFSRASSNTVIDPLRIFKRYEIKVLFFFVSTA